MERCDQREPSRMMQMEPEEVDISNVALLLRIIELEKTVKNLKRQLAEIEPKADHAYLHTIRIGGGS